jgi:hypothetical protein
MVEHRHRPGEPESSIDPRYRGFASQGSNYISGEMLVKQRFWYRQGAGDQNKNEEQLRGCDELASIDNVSASYGIPTGGVQKYTATRLKSSLERFLDKYREGIPRKRSNEEEVEAVKLQLASGAKSRHRNREAYNQDDTLPIEAHRAEEEIELRRQEYRQQKRNNG